MFDLRTCSVCPLKKCRDFVNDEKSNTDAKVTILWFRTCHHCSVHRITHFVLQGVGVYVRTIV